MEENLYNIDFFLICHLTRLPLVFEKFIEDFLNFFQVFKSTRFYVYF